MGEATKTLSPRSVLLYAIKGCFMLSPVSASPPLSTPFSSRTRNALAIFLAFAVSTHRVVGSVCAGGLFRRRDFKERRRKGVVTVVRVRASVELVRLYVLLYAASAIALASRINYTTRRMFLFHPPSISLSPRTVLPGCTARYIPSSVEESALSFCPPLNFKLRQTLNSVLRSSRKKAGEFS